ncbi:MAG: 16S rRNA (adenine(1518)-N(6)/adenine(1519)-N(6))-dimethyltransferase RsmA [Mucilaginibacter polytrichastri]|nr:16S rRNA (adenine(1518)-N(6)/adenine(1519)-N(6))-dimethyltransferase RsmA [Mucilaginibacter polytrichastri]
MEKVRAKKHLGQHFLTDPRIAQRIVDALQPEGRYRQVLEVGPGMGVLSDHLLQRGELESFLVDVDVESFDYLKTRYPELGDRLLNADFLAMNFADVFPGKMGIIGNFPYNISSQILFKVLDNRDKVLDVVGMFQREVAERCAAKPGGKEYGILSVLLQAWYKVDYLFTVKAGSFNPPPKVQSGVIRLQRNASEKLDCDEKLFWQVVKAGFNQRRKTLRNALSSLIIKEKMADEPLLEKRAETLSVADFVYLTQLISRIRQAHSESL